MEKLKKTPRKAAMKRQRKPPTLDRQRLKLRDKLKRLASQLRALVHREDQELNIRTFPRSIDPDLAALLVGAIERYLSEDITMDRALGLVRDGPQSKPGEGYELARDEIGWRLMQGKSFHEIWFALDMEYSEEMLRDVWKREGQYVIDEYAKRCGKAYLAG